MNNSHHKFSKKTANVPVERKVITPTSKKKSGIVKPIIETTPIESEMNIPDYAIERLARCMLPLIQKYYESEEGQNELKRWQKPK